MPILLAIPPYTQVASAPEMAASLAAEQAETLRKLQGKMPSTAFKSIESTPIKGLFAVKTAGNKVFYTDKEAKYFIAGIIFDTATGKSLNNVLEGKAGTALQSADFGE